MAANPIDIPAETRRARTLDGQAQRVANDGLFRRSRADEPERAASPATSGSNVAPNGGGGDNGGMDRIGNIERRVGNLEAAVAGIGTDVTVIKGNYATKTDISDLRGDLHKMDAGIVRWMIVTILGLFFGFAGLFFAGAKQAPQQPAAPVMVQPAPAQPSIIINVPPAAQPAPQQPAK